jgi:hypothetical protein
MLHYYIHVRLISVFDQGNGIDFSSLLLSGNLLLRKLVMFVNGHYIIRFWFLLASTAMF